MYEKEKELKKEKFIHKIKENDLKKEKETYAKQM